MKGESEGVQKYGRRDFMGLGAGSVAVAAFFVSKDGAQAQAEKPRLELDMVYDFVSAAHTDLDKVKRLLGEERALLNASWDWGNGDWETGIEGAGHMGRRDITQYLLDEGARMNIFIAAMMGYKDAVKGMLEPHPNLVDSRGPHGFTLQRYARAGGDEAKSVFTYLERLKST